MRNPGAQQPNSNPNPTQQQQQHHDNQTAIITNKTNRRHPGGSSPPEAHNQPIADPLAHFLAIPWTARLLTDPSAFGIVVSDRRPLASGEKQFVRGVLNGEATVRACVTFLVRVPPSPSSNGSGGGIGLLSKSKALLQGGGPQDGEDPEKPFLLFNALLDLGEGMCGFKGMLHGGAVVVLLDETMCAAANNQCDYTFTATMTTSFLSPVKLPGPVIVRSRVVRKQGRKIFVRGAIEDGDGEFYESRELYWQHD
ncbi:HotDog domain-containing protein [Parachaetomium inaequale]|uniref:HotDog domain-containing protein n=1 Tax=Parachaetomium inaequale TaxID=2588326 RepID=A0AAN6SR27_9PEZI|nr:HotDog domain-containing protein [Parachaetomium inaequale]